MASHSLLCFTKAGFVFAWDMYFGMLDAFSQYLSRQAVNPFVSQLAGVLAGFQKIFRLWSSESEHFKKCHGLIEDQINNCF